MRAIEENAEAAKARAREALAAVEMEAEATRAAMKQKMMAAAKAPLVKKEVPQKLKILPDDPEDVVSWRMGCGERGSMYSAGFDGFLV